MKHLVILLLASVLSATALAQQADFPAPPKDWPAPVHDSPIIPFLFVDRLERRFTGGKDAALWDVQAWIGDDYNKFWLKSEGENEGARTEQGDVQALYARLLSPFWYLQAGVRAHLRPQPSRNSLVLALQGLAPYWFDVEASAFLDERGKLSGRFEAEYDQLLTQRWILQPRIETNFSASNDEERGLRRGFNDVEVGLRLRYELRRQVGPYIGVNWSRRLGATADLARNAGESVTERSFVLGIRIWY